MCFAESKYICLASYNDIEMPVLIPNSNSTEEIMKWMTQHFIYPEEEYKDDLSCCKLQLERIVSNCYNGKNPTIEEQNIFAMNIFNMLYYKTDIKNAKYGFRIVYTNQYAKNNGTRMTLKSETFKEIFTNKSSRFTTNDLCVMKLKEEDDPKPKEEKVPRKVIEKITTKSANKQQQQKKKEREEYERQVAECARIKAEQEKAKKMKKAKK